MFLTVRSSRRTSELVSALEAGSCEFDRRTDPGSEHVVDARYRVDPPAGGDHAASAAPAGVFTRESAPADPNLVHSLEHGYVAIWYRGDLAAEEQERVVAVADRYDRDVLAVERSSLDTPVAATAWGARLLCSAVEPDVLERFVEEYRNQGPERVPH